VQPDLRCTLGPLELTFDLPCSPSGWTRAAGALASNHSGTHMLSLSYDFIIVGGGSSGALLARELASKGPTLLIDRGYNHSMFPQSAVPEGAPGPPLIMLR
jgi:hypothetical protein